jgi:hypothetical protein
LFVIGVVTAAHLVITIINRLKASGLLTMTSASSRSDYRPAASDVLNVSVSQLAPVLRRDKNDVAVEISRVTDSDGHTFKRRHCRSLNTSSGVRRTMIFPAVSELWPLGHRTCSPVRPIGTSLNSTSQQAESGYYPGGF